jgi:transcriptional regulator with XRE-family HTH domain
MIAHVHSRGKVWQKVLPVARLRAMTQTLAELILGLRLAHGLTQEELAQRAGLKQPTIADIERGRSKLPGADIRRRLADALGIRHVDLLVAAGELTTAEIAPLPATFIADFRLQEIVTVWTKMTPELQSAVHTTVRALIRVPGLLEDDEAPIVALSR